MFLNYKFIAYKIACWQFTITSSLERIFEMTIFRGKAGKKSYQTFSDVHLLTVFCLLVFIAGCGTDKKQAESTVLEKAYGVVDFSLVKSPLVLQGDDEQAFRDPAAYYYNGVMYIYYTYWLKDADGKRYSYTAMSTSSDLINWSEPKIITPKNLNLNFSSPGNVIRYGNEWILCHQTYPTPNGEKYGNKDCRLWINRSRDLVNWGPAEMLMVKGTDVAVEDMGRLIDPYLIEDKDEPGKWWCFFDDNAANMSWSYDLKNWNYFNRIECGENPCVLVENDEYLLIYDPKDEYLGAGMKVSKDLVHWRDVKERIGLGGDEWEWAPGGIGAAFVIDLRSEPSIGKYLMFFQAGPGFKENVSIGMAWSEDLKNWDWPDKN